MKESILGPKVENIAVAIVKEALPVGEGYNVYLINYKEEIIEGIIVSSSGYGKNAETGEEIRTSVLRHCIELMLPNEAARLEPIMEEVFGLNNEYLLSFWMDGVMHDKKFIFLPNTIKEEAFVDIPLLGKRGVLIK